MHDTTQKSREYDDERAPLCCRLMAYFRALNQNLLQAQKLLAEETEKLNLARRQDQTGYEAQIESLSLKHDAEVL